MSLNPTYRLADLRLDGGTQSRATLSEDTIAAYAELYKAGVELPAPVVFDDGNNAGTGDVWLADGFHRVYGAQRAGLTELPCRTLLGTQRDAWLYSLSANATHGLPRSNADKRRAVEAALADSEVGAWSHRKIAKLCAVSHEFVRQVSTVDTQPKVTGGSEAVVAPGRETAAKANLAQPPTNSAGPINPGVTSFAGNQQEGDEGAGVLGAHDASAPGEPGPDEEAWFVKEREPATDRDRLVNVERMIRDAQAELAPLLAKGEAMAVQAQLVAALEAVRRALEPKAVKPAYQPGTGAMLLRAKQAAPRVKVLLETPSGEVPFEDVPDMTDEDVF